MDFLIDSNTSSRSNYRVAPVSIKAGTITPFIANFRSGRPDPHAATSRRLKAGLTVIAFAEYSNRDRYDHMRHTQNTSVRLFH